MNMSSVKTDAEVISKFKTNKTTGTLTHCCESARVPSAFPNLSLLMSVTRTRLT